MRSVSVYTDRTISLRFKVDVRELADIFDGTEQLLAVTSVHWIVREVFKR